MSLNNDTLSPTIGRLDVYTKNASVGDRRAVFTYHFLARYLDWWANRCKRTKGHSHNIGLIKLLLATSQCSKRDTVIKQFKFTERRKGLNLDD